MSGLRSRDDLTALPPLPDSTPPDDAEPDDPLVPERKRFCHECRKPAGRAAGNGEPDNFCTNCGAPVSFRPPLRPGDVAADHFHIDRAIGHGGLGWVYRAWDDVLKIPVVLKGLMDPDDPQGRQAATAELEALARAQHRNIVRVYRKIEHPLRRQRRDGSLHTTEIDYIVMDYVPGRTLKELLAAGGPMPVGLALRYTIKILDALQHLHGRQLLYCDLAPDQVIHTNDEPADVRLIDLGAVRRVDSDDVHTYGKLWYQDPEITHHHTRPTIATDLYTVGRTVARLCIPPKTFPNHELEGEPPLPKPDRVPLLAEHDSFHRLLWRFLHKDHARRFASAAEAAVQAEGVLREETARTEDKPCPGPSTLFGPEVGVVGADPTSFPRGQLDGLALALPDLQVDLSDPHAGLIAALATMSPSDLRRELRSVPGPSPESRLRAALAGIRAGDADRVAGQAELDELSNDRPRDPRLLYARGVAALADDQPGTASRHFTVVLDAWPGELAPKLALGACAERRERRDVAVGHYQTVWRTDRSYVSAAFGLARCLVALDDRVGAAEALESVPETSRYATAARVGAILARERDQDPREPPADGFFTAAEQLRPGNAALADLDERQRQQITAEVLERALSWVGAGKPWPPDRGERVPEALLGHPLTVHGLRDGLEHTYRNLGALDPHKRIEYIDHANMRRNRSWW